MPEPILHRARRAAFRSERRFLLGSREILVRFGGPALEEELTPALAHLPPGSGDGPDLTVYALDGEEAGFDPKFDFTDRARSHNVEFPSLFARHPDGFTVWEPVRRSLTVTTADGSEALYWIPGPAAVSPRDRTAPFRLAFHRWARERGRALLHASGVGTEAGGLLLTGPNGSGKSTAALACLGTGLGFAGDDQVLVELSEPRAFGLYCSAGLETRHLETLLPRLAGVERTYEAFEPEKALLRLIPDHRDWLVHEFPVRALVVPMVVGRGNSSLTDLPASRALTALAPGTIYQLPAGGSDLAALADLVKRLPCFRLRLGRDLASLPPLLVDLLRSLQA